MLYFNQLLFIRMCLFVSAKGGSASGGKAFGYTNKSFVWAHSLSAIRMQQKVAGKEKHK